MGMRFLLIFMVFLSSVLSASSLKLTDKQAHYVATEIWHNEGLGLDTYLVHWNKGEDFASVGIGHFIWFSKGHTERFREVFPMFIAFIEKEGVDKPLWLTSKTPLPWASKKALYQAKKRGDKKYRELFSFLKATMGYQATFMAERLSRALPTILSTLKDEKKKKRIKENFNQVLYSKNFKLNEKGLYVLVDYTNFKGEGTLKSERYANQGWGLLQVLEHMDTKEKNRLKAFALSAKKMLARRIRNSPPARGEKRWRRGWNIRLRTYWN